MMSLGPNSRLALDQFAFNTTTHGGVFNASLQKGTLAVKSGQIIVRQTHGGECMFVRRPHFWVSEARSSWSAWMGRTDDADRGYFALVRCSNPACRVLDRTGGCPSGCRWAYRRRCRRVRQSESGSRQSRMRPRKLAPVRCEARTEQADAARVGQGLRQRACRASHSAQVLCALLRKRQRRTGAGIARRVRPDLCGDRGAQGGRRSSSPATPTGSARRITTTSSPLESAPTRWRGAFATTSRSTA